MNCNLEYFKCICDSVSFLSFNTVKRMNLRAKSIDASQSADSMFYQVRELKIDSEGQIGSDRKK